MVQLAEVQAQAPLAQTSPAAQGGFEPQLQPPSGSQVSLLLAQAKQLSPLTPHSPAFTAVTHTPPSLQQPVQVLGSQMQSPS